MPFPALALTSTTFKDLDLSIAVGPSWYKASNGYVQPYPTETDLDHVDHVTKSTSYQIGIGYHLFAEQLANRQFFNDFLIQLNASQSSATIKGDVWDAGNPSMQYQSFKAPFTTTRLMVDIKPSLVSYMNTMFYPIAGLGIAWNRLSYTETQTTSYIGAVDAPAHTSKNLVYDLGLGLSSKITENMRVTVEYISTHLGRMAPCDYSTSEQTVSSMPNFPVQTTTVLFGLSWRF